jgi:hypothetical protein
MIRNCIETPGLMCIVNKASGSTVGVAGANVKVNAIPSLINRLMTEFSWLILILLLLIIHRKRSVNMIFNTSFKTFPPGLCVTSYELRVDFTVYAADPLLHHITYNSYL